MMCMSSGLDRGHPMRRRQSSDRIATAIEGTAVCDFASAICEGEHAANVDLIDYHKYS